MLILRPYELSKANHRVVDLYGDGIVLNDTVTVRHQENPLIFYRRDRWHFASVLTLILP